jgi:hypothetical protein
LPRTSGFADFANFSIPSTEALGVLSKFNTDANLHSYSSDILSTKLLVGWQWTGYSKINFRNQITLFRSVSNISEDYKILGIVTSDKDNSNVNARNLFIQDASGAIQFVFSQSFLCFRDELEINLKE